MLYCLTVDLLFHNRQNLVPDPVAGIRIFFVRLISTIGNLLLFQPRFNLFPRQTEQWTDPVSVNRTNPAHSLKPASPRQIQKYCLCIIIFMMCRRNLIRTGLPAYSLKSIAPYDTACFFKRFFPIFCN